MLGVVLVLAASAGCGAGEDARPTVRIDAAGAAQVVGDVAWDGCTDFETCAVVVDGVGIDVGTGTPVEGVEAPAVPSLYDTEWTGGASRGVGLGKTAFSFAIPVDAGRYRVRLHFAERVQTEIGARLFDVDVEGGAPDIVALDVLAEAGGMHRALVKDVGAEVADGTLDLAFLRRRGNAIVSAIEVLPQTSSATPAPELVWDEATPAPLARFEANGAAVDGRVYVVSGYDGPYDEAAETISATARADVYAPDTDSWSPLADAPVAFNHAPAVVDGTTIWFLGGFVGDYPWVATDAVWGYDTVTDTWQEGPRLPAVRGAGAAAIVGRTIHFYGGMTGVPGQFWEDHGEHWALDLDAYAPAWLERASLPDARNHLGGVALDGQVYAIGGQHRSSEDEPSASVHRYDPGSDAWMELADLPTARGHITASVGTAYGHVVVAGGSTVGHEAMDEITAYDPAGDSWVEVGTLPAPRKTPVAAIVGDRAVVTTGDPGPSSPTADTWVGRLGGGLPTSDGDPVSG